MSWSVWNDWTADDFDDRNCGDARRNRALPWANGQGDAFAAAIEQAARAELDRQEMFQIDGRLERGPLRRTLVLSGPADDFQREELPKIMLRLRGVDAVRWDPTSLPVEPAR